MGRKRQSSDDLLISFEPRTEAQNEAFKLYTENDILFFLGPAGSGKTLTAVYCALYDKFSRVKQKHIDKIVVTRPIVEAGEKLGFLPGDLEEKVHPYMMPIYHSLKKLVNYSDELFNESFEITPLAYMRGITFENSIAILDEAQNCTLQQIKMFLTRLGFGSKLIITGDPDQSDIGDRSGLSEVIFKLRDLRGVGIYSFTDEDIVRHPLIRPVLRRLTTN